MFCPGLGMYGGDSGDSDGSSNASDAEDDRSDHPRTNGIDSDEELAVSFYLFAFNFI